jgi:hypothetical protein
MVFSMLFALLMIGVMLYAMNIYLPRVFLNFRKTLNPLMIQFPLVKEKGISHLTSFGASVVFTQMNLDLSEPKMPKLQVKLKPEIKRVHIECLCFDEKAKFISVLPYQIIAEEETAITLPKKTTHVIPVITKSDDSFFEWNTYLLPRRQFLSFASTESIAIGLLIHYLIQFISFFYQTFTATCPLCQFDNQSSLQALSWGVGGLTFIVIMIVGQARLNQYMYGGLIHDSDR